MASEIEEQELESADAAHQLLDGRQAAAGCFAQLAVHGGKRKKDRGELLRHLARVLARCSEEEVDASARIADAAEQVFDAVHGAQATRRT